MNSIQDGSPSQCGYRSTACTAVSKSLQVVGEVKSRELRDFRQITVEELCARTFHDPTLPTAHVQTLALGLELTEDGEITSKETTRVHLHQGTLYWEPFGW